MTGILLIVLLLHLQSLPDAMNLKKLLMQLGNRLVLERGFIPGYSNQKPGEPNHDTFPITQFTQWLNNTPEAIEILEEMGVKWPTV